ncbi:hypothetical protein JQ607_10735 [Bradyrhizobium liaoningense]|nr:hypothetical protein [Bradyrhizobium liaoningense]
MLNHDRRSYSPNAVLVVHRASGFNFEIELKNIILRRVSIFEFSHSQDHKPPITLKVGNFRFALVSRRL